MNKRITTKSLVTIGMFAAVLVILSQVQIQLPSGIPITLQTFAIALVGYTLGKEMGIATVFLYILLGAIGIPVFAGFKGGLEAILGYTGGFIIGFPFMAYLCGMRESYFIKFNLKKNVRFFISLLLGLIGLMIVHILGTMQYSKLAELEFLEGLLVVSLPFLIKDIVSIVAALYLGDIIKDRIKKM